MLRKESNIRKKSFDFAVRILKLGQYLIDNKREFIISKQLSRSGTSIGACVREAENGESKADFIHKLGIAQKEADETMYWLEILYTSEYLTENEFNSIYPQAEELLKIIRTIIINSKKNK